MSTFRTILVSFIIYFLYGRFTISLLYIFSWNVVGLIRTTIGMKTNILIAHRRSVERCGVPFSCCKEDPNVSNKNNKYSQILGQKAKLTTKATLYDPPITNK